MSSNSDEMLIDNHYNDQIRICKVVVQVNHFDTVTNYSTKKNHHPAVTCSLAQQSSMPGHSPVESMELVAGLEFMIYEINKQ